METSVKAPDLSKLLKKIHENKWVAFSTDYKKIVDYSSKLPELHRKTSTKKVIYYKVLPADIVFAPTVL